MKIIVSCSDFIRVKFEKDGQTNHIVLRYVYILGRYSKSV